MPLTLITGASKGIGKAYAEALAAQGHDLILIARTGSQLTALKHTLEMDYHVAVTVYVLDLTDATATSHFVSEVLPLFLSELTGFISNAGFGASGTFTTLPYAQHDAMLTAHLVHFFQLAHPILSHFKRHQAGLFIVVSSIVSFGAFPKQGLYCATKACLTNFVECYHLDTLDMPNLHVQCLCPGLVQSHFYDTLPLPTHQFRSVGLFRWMTPEAVVQYSLRHHRRYATRRPIARPIVVIPGAWNRILYHGHALLPKRWAYRLARRGWDWIASEKEGEVC